MSDFKGYIKPSKVKESIKTGSRSYSSSTSSSKSKKSSSDFKGYIKPSKVKESIKTGSSKYSSSSSSSPKKATKKLVSYGNLKETKPSTPLSIPQKRDMIITGFLGDVVVPQEIKDAGAEKEYIYYSRQSYLGLPTKKQSERKLSDKLQTSYTYVSEHQLYKSDGKDKTFSQLKEEEPALYLKQDSKTGKWNPQYDFVRWREEYRKKREKKGIGAAGVAADVSQSFLSIFDVGTWKASIEGNLPEYMARQQYYDVMDINKGKSFEVWARVQDPAYANVIIPAVVGAGVGAGVGAFKATSIGSKAILGVGSRTLTTGGAVELGIAGYGTYEVGKSAVKDPLGTGISLVISAPSAILGYKSGYRTGYGRTEAYLYGKNTYKPGSADYIRYREAIKIGRQTQYIKSNYAKPLDFAKDIMRLKPSEATRVMNYFKNTRGTVLGGSAASYTQVRPSLWTRFRGSVKPRDVDLLVKDVSQAKSYFGKTPHKIDVHGYEFGGKGGRYHRFGFMTQSPKKIGGIKTMRLSEQSFRKGIGGTSLESGYRWFKDVPDFVMTSEQLISSSKTSWNPFTRLRGSIASKHLKIFKNPTSSKFFGKSDTVFSRGINKVFKPAPSPKTVYSGGGYVDYVYPSYSMPSYVAGVGVASVGYYPSSGYKSLSISYVTPKTISPSYTSPKTVTPTYTPPKVTNYVSPSYTSPKTVTPTYTPPKTIKYYSPKYINPKYTPPKTIKYYSPKYINPKYTPPSYPPGLPPDKTPVKIDEFFSKRKFKMPVETFDISYKFREFKISKLFKNIKI